MSKIGICDPADVQPFRIAAKLALAMIAMTARCGACTVVYQGVRVGPNFRVKVEDHGRPIKGLRVAISSYQESGNRSVIHTDKNGFASFHGVRPGSYHLSADHDAGIPDGAELEVRSDGPRGVTVPLKWPIIAPVLVRSLRGIVRAPDYFPGQSHLSLDLLEGSSGRKMRSLQTTDSGEFDFGSIPPGLYFLSVRSGEQIAGLVAVAVDNSAPTEHLDVDLGWTSCGLWYADHSKCPQSDLRMGQFSGQVLDAAGEAIPNARILLFDTAKTLVERLQSDSAGRFASPNSLAGTYQLVVSAGGFTPLLRTLHVEPTGNPSRLLGLTAQLGLPGSCSHAGLQ